MIPVEDTVEAGSERRPDRVVVYRSNVPRTFAAVRVAAIEIMSESKSTMWTVAPNSGKKCRTDVALTFSILGTLSREWIEG